MANKLSYVIKFVSDMDRAVSFYSDTLGLALKFESPGWSEFLTGETTLALHAADADHHAVRRPAGRVCGLGGRRGQRQRITGARLLAGEITAKEKCSCSAQL